MLKGAKEKTRDAKNISALSRGLLKRSLHYIYTHYTHFKYAFHEFHVSNPRLFFK